MPIRYQDVYPENPAINSTNVVRQLASDLLTLEYFEAAPGDMPHEVFSQHHILINLKDEPHRVENWRDDNYRDFIYHHNEIIVTPAGIKSGWKWHAKSKVIVITLEPDKLENFAQTELGRLLTHKQLKDIPQFIDEDITQAAIMLMDALKNEIGSSVMFESFARIFLTKLIQKYGLISKDEISFKKGFTSKHYKRVLDYVSVEYGREITIDTMAMKAGLSTAHFSRLFKETIGKSPHQFVMSYRVEKAREMLANHNKPLIDIALSCGFADQAHFSRVFKQFGGVTPKTYRKSL